MSTVWVPWRQVAAAIGGGRTPKSCQRRYQKLCQLKEANNLIAWRLDADGRQIVEKQLNDAKTGRGRSWQAAEEHELFVDVCSTGWASFCSLLSFLCSLGFVVSDGGRAGCLFITRLLFDTVGWFKLESKFMRTASALQARFKVLLEERKEILRKLAAGEPLTEVERQRTQIIPPKMVWPRISFVLANANRFADGRPAAQLRSCQTAILFLVSRSRE